MARKDGAVIEEPVTGVDAQALTDGFYHYGLLPASGDVLFPVQERDAREMTLRKMSSYDLWNNAQKVGLEKGIRIFVAKARQYFGLSVRGFHFPSVNEFVEMGDQNTSRSSFPGGVALLTADQAKAVVKSCYKHWIHFPNGLEKCDDPTQPTEVRDDEWGVKPAGWTSEEWSAYRVGHAVPTPYVFNPKKDKHIAEFVYLYRLPVDPDGVDAEEYRKNPNRFNYQFVGPVTKQLFDSPPKSVAEMYPPTQT